jgi:2-polyprenyl-6-methoxyphenol hydroxylase-like FAD-dependent oxidoreductase
LRVLEWLRLHTAIRDSGAPIERLLGTTAGGRTILDLRYADAWLGVPGIGIHRGALSAALWTAVQAGGIELRTGCAIDAIAQEVERVSIRRDSSAALEWFDLAVIADGTFSQLRTQLAIRHRIDVYPWGAWWAILPDRERRYQGVLRQTYRRAARMLGIMPIGRSPAEAGAATSAPHVTLFWSVRRDDEAQQRARGFAAWKDEVAALSPDAEPLLSRLAGFDQLLFATYADVRMAAWHDRRIVIIGDAAHATSPQLGQGANLGLIDAAVLARCIGAHNDVATALAAYSVARRAHLGYYQWASSLLTPVFQSDARLLPWLRDMSMGLACRLPVVRGQMLSTLTGVKAGLLRGTLKLD